MLKRDVFPYSELFRALVAFLFAISAPVIIILSVGIETSLNEEDISSWIFAVFTFNGLLSIAMSVRYRQPLVFLWTIPGAILVGSALDTLNFEEVLGSYVLTGLLLILLGITGSIKKVLDLLPSSIVMGMVAGVFIKFGIDWIEAFEKNFLLVTSMSLVFFFFSADQRLSKFLPPLIWSLMTGMIVIFYDGTGFTSDADIAVSLVSPKAYVPQFSLAAIFELVIPLTVTVVAAQNAQGIAILRSSSHSPPINAITTSCGFMSVFTALFGGISTCLTGPVNAILVSDGKPEKHWIAALFLGLLAILFGLAAPTVTALLLMAPAAFISTLAALALMKTLLSAFDSTFKHSFPLGGLISFLVTLSGIQVFNIGAPFWGLVFGAIVSS